MLVKIAKERTAFGVTHEVSNAPASVKTGKMKMLGLNLGERHDDFFAILPFKFDHGLSVGTFVTVHLLGTPGATTTFTDYAASIEPSANKSNVVVHGAFNGSIISYDRKRSRTWLCEELFISFGGNLAVWTRHVEKSLDPASSLESMFDKFGCGLDGPSQLVQLQFVTELDKSMNI